MRRILFGVALVTLLVILLAAPALAAPVAKQGVAANEVLIAQRLVKLGVLPRYATPDMVENAVRAFVGPGPNEKTQAPAVSRALAGKRTSLGRFLVSRVDDPSATETYTTKTLVLLVEFGTDPWPDGDSSGHDMDGPLHGEIPPPAADDNATFWPGDFSRMHYQQELFGNSYPLYDADGKYRGSSDDTMRTYYLEMSKGTFTVAGDIADWVQLDVPESYYGADSASGTDDLTGPVWRIARDAVLQFAAENPDFPWAEYDQENPFGINEANGGAFDQPDGIIDHLTLIHAGSDQSAGGGAQGTDAIWAHSWGILENYGQGPGGAPGAQIPGTIDAQHPKGIWAYNYTINPEDGDPGVFCHEFGHDLGLPDQYDYSSATGDATSGFWTLMASGSWLGRQWGLGTKPAPMNVWDKTALGFITPKTVKRGATQTVKLEPAATGTPGRSGVKIMLPKRKHVIELSGKDGAMEWYSNFGNDLSNTLETKAAVNVPGSNPTLTLRTWYDIEYGYDWGFVWVSDDNGATWETARSAATVSAGGGVYGLTGTDVAHWSSTMSYDLSAWAGKNVLVRFEYYTDGGVANLGWEITDVKVGGATIATEALDSAGWQRVDGATTRYTDNYYIAEYRTYDGYDEALKNCYQWNFDYYSWVDWFRYNRGLHLIYRDTFWLDNDVAMHEGEGGWQVVDARPIPDSETYPFGGGFAKGYWRPRIQVRDASFSLKPTQTQSVYYVDYDAGYAIGERTVAGKLAQPWFNDAWTYWYSQAPEAGVKIPRNLGVRIQVKSMNADGMTIWVDNKK